MSDNQPELQIDGLSGIQLTLKDLAGTPGYRLRDEDSPAPSPINPDGWLGLPDPGLYDPGVEQLTSSQLKKERKKGNIISLADLQRLPWKKKQEWLNKQQRVVQRVRERLPALSSPQGGRGAASSKPKFDTSYKMNMLTFLLSKPNPDRPKEEAPLWKDPEAMMRVMTDWMQHHCWIRLSDHTLVSLWNLFQYVERNPEMEALIKRDIAGFDTTSQGPAPAWERLQRLMPWQVQAGSTKLQLDPAAEAALPQGLVATGNVWARRPSKWLWGMDALRDFSYGLYVHEDFAEHVMAGKWGGRAPQEVAQNPEYRSDLVNYGADMNMTVLAQISRELPLDEHRRMWEERLAATLKLYQPREGALQSLQELTAIFEPQRLAEQTQLMTPDGSHLRAGGKLLFNTNSLGQLTVQAISPGTLKEQESYVLGVVEDRQLCSALLGTFLDPRAGAEEGFAAQVAHKMVFYINGFKSRNRDDNPHQRLMGTPAPFDAEVVRASRRLFALPRVGLPPFPTLVSTVADRKSYEAIEHAFTAAHEAAEQISNSVEDAPQRKQRAAEAALSRVLVPLGVPAVLLQGSCPPPPPELHQVVQPLEVQDES